jgi:hypothetical protein
MKKNLLLLFGTLLVLSTLPYSTFAKPGNTRLLIVHNYGETHVSQEASRRVRAGQ